MASTVGTIMAILVFLSLMALITNSYVPAWMLDNEREHMNQVIDQFGELKGKVDSMVVQWTVRGGPSSNMYAPISLGSSGVPLFASPTIGILATAPQDSSISAIEMTFDPDGRGLLTDRGGGKVELYCPNRYYVQQWLAYENGAIIMKQEDGQALRAYPGLVFSNTSSGVNIQFTKIDIVGPGTIVSGSGSVGLNIEMVYVESETYSLSGEWKLKLTTEYGEAWTTYLEGAFSQQGMVNGTDYKLASKPVTDAKTDVTIIDLTVKNVNVLTVDNAVVRMTTVDS